MRNIGKNKGYPCKKQIPDQPGMPARIAICDSRHYQTDTYQARGIEQSEHGNVIAVTNEEISETVEHNVFYISLKK
jgi:hypothetical protein